MNNIQFMLVKGICVVLAGAIRNATDQDPETVIEKLLLKNERIIEMVSTNISRSQIKELLKTFLEELQK